jgi:hypothetical protein
LDHRTDVFGIGDLRLIKARRYLFNFLPRTLSSSLQRWKPARTRRSSRWIIWEKKLFCSCPLEAPLNCPYKTRVSCYVDQVVLKRFRTTSDPNPFRTLENMVRWSRRTISMVICALDPVSVIQFLTVIPESPSRKRFLTDRSSHSIL